jgi:CRISPR/Cas system CSM-associated protein Csm2 small subunit
VTAYSLAKPDRMGQLGRRNMSELQIIQTTLERAARRRRFARALRGLWTGLLVGALVWLMALGVFKLAPVSAAVLLWAGWAAIACPLAGFVFGGWRRPALVETARWVDVRQHLKERLSTALEFSAADHAGTWRELVLHDAVSHAQEIDPRKLVPFHLPKATRWALLVLALAAGLGFVPEYRSKAYLQKQADAKVIREVGKQIADLTRREIKQRPPALDTTRKSLEIVSDLGQKLEKASLTRGDALRDLASVSDKLKNEVKDLARDPGLKKLAQAARAPGRGDSLAGASLQKQIEQLQKQLGQQTGGSAALDKLQKDLEKLQQAAKDLADQSGTAADAERQKLSAQLSALSQQAAQLGVQLPQLDEAIAALAAQNTGLFVKDLDQALNDLEKLRDMAKRLEDLQAMAEKIGKDLAEQLKYGQAEAAADTLKKFAEQMKSANLTPEQMRKILDEVTRALPPAQEYGKVADYLKQACQQGQTGDRAGASQSLAAAAKELEELLEKMADAQSLMASLENLEQASTCIGQCKGWGLSQSRKGGFNPFGRNPGSGVGTWGQEGGEWIESGDWTAHVDNSGIRRPDLDPRGLTERERSDLTDRLKPDKVRGQFSPGGQMPSITLKGVSIKGTSRVQYEEAVAAAQSDAESALSQQKVPRAYQGAVRDYFDDLKK